MLQQSSISLATSGLRFWV